MLRISAIWEVEIKRMVVQDHPKQKVSKTPSQPISQVWWYTTMAPATWGL
jgi:hypothetical protein